MKEYLFTIILEPDEGGGYHVFCPILKGCHSHGDTIEEATCNIRDAISLYTESLLEHNEPVPEEDFLIKPLRVAL